MVSQTARGDRDAPIASGNVQLGSDPPRSDPSVRFPPKEAGPSSESYRLAAFLHLFAPLWELQPPQWQHV